MTARGSGVGTAILLALATTVLAGCGLGAGETPEDVTLLVTDDFGARTVVREDRPAVEGEDTVMRLLRRNAQVGTAYGGTFVTSIAGRRGGDEASGGTQDWVFFVNGILADRAATSTALRDGDRVWWDRDDTTLATVRAVVGSFPQPLAGADPLDVACITPTARSCRTVVQRLEAAGVRADVRGTIDSSPPGNGPRVVVGAWDRVRQAKGAGAFDDGPRRSGVFAVPVRDGLAAYDRAGRAGPVLRRWGLVAAMHPRGSDVTWLVTGSSESEVADAADQVTEQALRGRFALLLRDGRPEALPGARR